MCYNYLTDNNKILFCNESINNINENENNKKI